VTHSMIHWTGVVPIGRIPLGQFGCIRLLVTGGHIMKKKILFYLVSIISGVLSAILFIISVKELVPMCRKFSGTIKELSYPFFDL
jgi:hypothetical protein